MLYKKGLKLMASFRPDGFTIWGATEAPGLNDALCFKPFFKASLALFSFLLSFDCSPVYMYAFFDLRGWVGFHRNMLWVGEWGVMGIV